MKRYHPDSKLELSGFTAGYYDTILKLRVDIPLELERTFTVLRSAGGRFKY